MGVPVDHTNYDGMIHTFGNMRRLAKLFPNLEAANNAWKRASEVLREAFE